MCFNCWLHAQRHSQCWHIGDSFMAPRACEHIVSVPAVLCYRMQKSFGELREVKGRKAGHQLQAPRGPGGLHLVPEPPMRMTAMA